MAAVTDLPPAHVRTVLSDLRQALDETVPAKVVDRSLLVGTWNIRAFGDLTDRWLSGPADSPKRDLAALVCIAEILSRFDAVAVQEVRGNLRCLRHALKVLGPDWGVILTDVTKGKQGNNERLAFLFDSRRVKPSGLACELVLPDTDSVPDVSGIRQSARTPYAVSFAAGTTTFILVTLHVRYGTAPADRIGELAAISLLAGGLGPHRTRVGAQPARPRRLQHRPCRRPPVRGVHLHRTHPASRVERRPPHHLRPARQRTLLRPNRLVHRRRRRPRAHPAPHRRRRRVRLRPSPAGTTNQDRTVLANLRPLPALGRVRHPLTGTPPPGLSVVVQEPQMDGARVVGW
jgi:hypothetical protein